MKVARAYLKHASVCSREKPFRCHLSSEHLACLWQLMEEILATIAKILVFSHACSTEKAI
jgi:hypothetical protein